MSKVTLGFEQLLRHAQVFGPESVIEVAELLLPERELARLRVEVDLLERRRSRYGPRRRRSTQETLLAAVAMREEGLVIGYIAEKLGVTAKTVRELLARHRRESAPRQAQSQGLDPPSRSPKTASLSGENAAETADMGNGSRQLAQPQSRGATAGSAEQSSRAEVPGERTSAGIAPAVPHKDESS
jgi:hypothetical protein